MRRDTRTSSPRRLSISEVRLSTGKECSEINHGQPSARALPAPGERGGDGRELGAGEGGPARADPPVGPSATGWPSCLGDTPRAGPKMLLLMIFPGSPWKWFHPRVSCTGTQHLCRSVHIGVHRASHPPEAAGKIPELLLWGGLEQSSECWGSGLPHISFPFHRCDPALGVAPVPRAPVWRTGQCWRAEGSTPLPAPPACQGI